MFKEICFTKARETLRNYFDFEIPHRKCSAPEEFYESPITYSGVKKIRSSGKVEIRASHPYQAPQLHHKYLTIIKLEYKKNFTLPWIVSFVTL